VCEVSRAREVRRHAGRLRSRDDLFVADRAARSHDRAHPGVVATVIYEGVSAGKAPKARTIVSYGTGPEAVPRATLHGLTGGREICLSAVNLVSLGGSVTNAASRPVCAVPR